MIIFNFLSFCSIACWCLKFLSFITIDFNENSQSLDLGCAWKYISLYYPFFIFFFFFVHSFSVFHMHILRSAWRWRRKWRRIEDSKKREFIKFIHGCVTMKSCFYHFAFFGWMRGERKERDFFMVKDKWGKMCHRKSTLVTFIWWQRGFRFFCILNLLKFYCD